jgi:hypothetical protein
MQINEYNTSYFQTHKIVKNNTKNIETIIQIKLNKDYEKKRKDKTAEKTK